MNKSISALFSVRYPQFIHPTTLVIRLTLYLLRFSVGDPQ